MEAVGPRLQPYGDAGGDRHLRDFAHHADEAVEGRRLAAGDGLDRLRLDVGIVADELPTAYGGRWTWDRGRSR